MKAIIYLPGLGVSVVNQAAESITHRIRTGIDINNEDESKKYRVQVRKEKFGSEGELETNVARIIDETNTPVIDVFEYDYAKELTGRFENQNLISKSFTLFFAIAFNLRKVMLGLIKGKGLGRSGKIQTIYTLLILILLSVFGILLVTSLPLFFAQSVKLEDNPTLHHFLFQSNFGSCLRLNFKWLTNNLNYGVGLMASLFLLFPDLKNQITNIAIEFVCLINYFNYGERNLSLMGKFDELLEHIAEHEEKYEEVIVLAYSFGSVLAMDALFPASKTCSVRVRQKIGTLITIACPYDFVRLYWQTYYENRVNCCHNLKRWYNVCSPVDVLSSNFRNDEREEDGNVPVTKGTPINPRNIFFSVIPSLELNTINILMLSGIRSHRMYWDEEKSSSSCFTSLIQAMKTDQYSLV